MRQHCTQGGIHAFDTAALRGRTVAPVTATWRQSRSAHKVRSIVATLIEVVAKTEGRLAAATVAASSLATLR